MQINLCVFVDVETVQASIYMILKIRDKEQWKWNQIFTAGKKRNNNIWDYTLHKPNERKKACKNVKVVVFAASRRYL